jgi:hypothetical protein
MLCSLVRVPFPAIQFSSSRSTDMDRGDAPADGVSCFPERRIPPLFLRVFFMGEQGGGRGHGRVCRSLFRSCRLRCFLDGFSAGLILVAIKATEMPCPAPASPILE